MPKVKAYPMQSAAKRRKERVMRKAREREAGDMIMRDAKERSRVERMAATEKSAVNKSVFPEASETVAAERAATIAADVGSKQKKETANGTKTARGRVERRPTGPAVKQKEREMSSKYKMRRTFAVLYNGTGFSIQMPPIISCVHYTMRRF